MNRLHRFVARVVAASLFVGIALVASTSSAHATSNGSIGVWQVGISGNCTKGDCGGSYGGFWGWAEFDSPANDPNAGVGGDGQFTGCSHGGGFSGAGHSVMDIHDWYVAPDPEFGGLPAFFASWTETDTFRGTVDGPFEVVNQPTGIPAFSVHRPLLQLFGIPTPPGQSFNAQVAWKPAH